MATQSVERHLDEFVVNVPCYGTILCDLYLSVELLHGEFNDVSVDTDRSLFYCNGCGCELTLSDSMLAAVREDAFNEFRDNWEDHAPLELPSRKHVTRV